jgi:hypothetical protein
MEINDAANQIKVYNCVTNIIWMRTTVLRIETF